MLDPDLDLLRLEAQAAQTSTRREWARRLVLRIEQLEANYKAFSESFVYPDPPSHVSEELADPPD